MINTAVETLRTLGRRPPAGTAEAERTARDLVRAGMPPAVIGHLARAFNTSVDEIQRIIGVSRATGTRRRASRAPLRPTSSDRAFRMASAYALAKRVFEDEQNAREWFKDPN